MSGTIAALCISSNTFSAWHQLAARKLVLQPTRSGWSTSCKNCRACLQLPLPRISCPGADGTVVSDDARQEIAGFQKVEKKQSTRPATCFITCIDRNVEAGLVRPDLLAWQALKQGYCQIPKLGLRIFLEHSIVVKSPGPSLGGHCRSRTTCT